MENNILNGENSENLNQENSSFFDEKVSSSNSNEGYPQLRFKEYKKPYSTFKLSDFTERITRKNSKNETELSLTISSKDGLIAQEHFFNKLVSSKDLSGYYLLKKGEFAYNKSYSVGFDFGSIKRLELYDKGALSTLYICFGVKGFKPEYIRHYFDSLKWYKEIYLIAAEGARNHGLLNVPTEQFFETKHILTTDLIEQQKIADFLSLVDKRIEKQRLLVENLKKYKRGLLVNIIDNLSEIKEMLIGASFYVQGGYAFKGELFQKTGIPIVRISNINDNNVDLADLIFYDSNIHIDSKFIIKNGDILIAMSGATTGKIGKYNNKEVAYLNQRVGKFTQKNNDADIGYLYQLLSSEYFTKGLKNLLVAGAQPNISPSDIESIVLPFPDLKYQEKISNLLSKIDILINKENEFFTKILSIKQGLLQQMFI